jgi:EmrB/QacA subfamily drug resistance transporter
VSATSPSSPAPASGADDYTLSHRQILAVLGGLMVATLLGALDQTIVATALPTIVGDLGSIQQISWVVTAYLLASTAATAIYGPISDVYGRKRVYQFAIVLFLIGSALSGAAQTMEQLIGARAIQGLGGGGLMVLAFAIIGDIIPPRERGRYTGYFGAVFGVSSIAGPLVGGYFVDNLSWRWIFYINIPLGIVALIVTSKVLSGTFTRREHRIDFLGAALLVSWTVAALIVLERGRVWGWGSWETLALAGTALILFALFVRHEFVSDEPILPLRIFRNRVFTVAGAAAFIGGLALFGAIFYLPVYLQIVKGLSPTSSGLHMLPLVMGLLASSIIAGRLITRWGRYRIFPIMGFSIVTVAMFALGRLESDTPTWEYSLLFALLGVGFGMTSQVLVLAAQNAVDRKDIGVATSTATFLRQMGGTFGAALFGTILAGALTTNLSTTFPNGPPAEIDAESITGSPAVIAALPEAVKGPVIEAFVNAVQVTFTAAVPIAIVALILALFLKDIKLKGRTDAPSPESSINDDDAAGAAVQPASTRSGTA